MAEQAASDIATIQAVADCDEGTARRWLKVKNNNADAVLNAIFDGEDLSKAEKSVTWNETDFSADREGNATYGPRNFAFDDGNLHALGQSAAPTRGSSPVPSFKQPSTRAEEDEEMQRALAASRQDQDVGVISGGKFGPATKDYYDPTNWAMTVSAPVDAHNTSEIVPDLEPHERQNRAGEPRFLKHLPSGDYLPNLLTIAHSIPLARKALLVSSHLQHSYGSDIEWWKGHTIRLPKIVSTVNGSLVDPPINGREDVVAEMQRLMALLDESTRSYGSADSLAQLAMSIFGSNSEIVSESMLDKVLYTWEMAAKDTTHEQLSDYEVFHSLIGTTSQEGLSTPNMWSLPLSIKTGSEQTVSLAEIMDNALWDMDTDEGAFCDNFMERSAHVLPMRVTQADSSKETLGIIIPPVFYVDKYLKENVDTTREIRKQMAQNKKRIDKIESVEFKLRNFKHPQNGSYLDASLVLKHALDHFSGQSRTALLAERESNGVGNETDLPPLPEHHSAIAERLSAVYKDIETKLEVLEKEKEKAREALSQLSQTTPSQDSSLSKHRYSLRGVATKPHVTYILRPRDVDDNDMIDDEDAPEGMQWWRIEYDVQVNGAKVMKTKSTQDDVIRAAELEHSQALLVYASDHAIMKNGDVELPAPLKEFIRQDDEHFNSELHNNDHGNVHTYPQFQTGQRRASTASSTVANYPDEEPPPYQDDFGSTTAFQVGGGGGGGDRKDDDLIESIQYTEGASPPAHEIKLDAMQNEGEGEMVEKAHPPLYKPGNGLRGSDGSDDTMVDVEDQHMAGTEEEEDKSKPE